MATGIMRPKGVTHPNVTYSGTLQVDIWKAWQPSARCLIVLHGGSWDSGARTDALYVRISELFWNEGFAIFNADYTLVGADGFTPQTPIDDVYALVQWVRANAATYNGDATRVAILGVSAGGHLGLMAGIEGTADDDRPDAVVSWSAPCDLEELLSTTDQEHIDALAAYMGVGYTGNEAAWQAKSPELIVSSNCPPIRIVGSDDETTPGLDETHYTEMHNAAVAASVDSTLQVFEGDTHGDFTGDLPHPSLGSAIADDLAGTSAWLKSKMP